MTDALETLVAEARSGSRDSLERLVFQIQRPVYNLALRMLWHPEDARDARGGSRAGTTPTDSGSSQSLKGVSPRWNGASWHVV